MDFLTRLKGLEGLKALRRRREAAAAEPPVPVSPHGSVAMADPYSFQASHRRMAWLLRICAGVIVVLGAAVVMLVNLIGEMLPLKTTEIALVRPFGPDDRLYRIEPITEKTEGFHVILESMARRYVRLVREIDTVTQDERLREASRMTDRAFSEKFRRDHLPSMTEAAAAGLVRTVNIVSSERIASIGREHKYMVDFVQVDTKGGKEIDRKNLRAYLSMTTRPQEVRESEKYSNPQGITVLDMVLKERGQ